MKPKDNAIWHKVTDSEKEEIKTKIEELLKEFSTKLGSVKGIEEHFSSTIAKNGQREEGKPWQTDQTFRDLFLLNAPFTEDDYLVAEKGGWKKKK